MNIFRSAIYASFLGILLTPPIPAQVTQRVSLSTSGVEGNWYTEGDGACSDDGRFIAFSSPASNLVALDMNGSIDVFVRDRQNGTTELVSVSSGGAQANFHAGGATISADGRYVAFYSGATNLVPGDTNTWSDVFVRDRQSGTTERVSVATGGAQATGYCDLPKISADGRYVAFESFAPNLVPGDTNGWSDIFVHDRQLGTTERVSVDAGGVEGNADSQYPSISGDGRYVAFQSDADNLVPGDTNGFSDIFVRDRQLGTIERANVDSSGAQSTFEFYDHLPSISADGRYVAFVSEADNLIPGDTNTYPDVYVHDRQGGGTERVSVGPGGAQGNDYSDRGPSISADGRYVAFTSFASNLVVGDTNGVFDTFLRDRLLGTTERVNVSSSGAQGNHDMWGNTSWPSVSADGRFVLFFSDASNLVPGDTAGYTDYFVRDRTGGPAFTSLCSPGVAGVIPCPCSNPPVGLGRGCNNSSATGGAILSASGGTYLSSDSLVLTTSGERATSLSIVAQWIGPSASGVAFGMGVRCTSGTFKRLFSKNAVAGSITVPNFGAGDPTISARSAAKGDTILAGQSRWYVVYYRDPNVLGGCSPLSNFNATQTGQVTWSP